MISGADDELARDYAAALGNERGAEPVEEQLRLVDDDRRARRRAVADAEARAPEWRAHPAVDEALDAHGERRALVTGALARARGAAQLNAALRSVLEAVWLTLSPAGALRAEFALRPSERVATWPLVRGDRAPRAAVRAGGRPRRAAVRLLEGRVERNQEVA